MDLNRLITMHVQCTLLAMGIVCPGFVIWMAPTVLQQWQSYEWPTTTGTVVEIRKDIFSSERGNNWYYSTVEYRYTVRGDEYTTDMTRLGLSTKYRDPEEALAQWADYQPGDEITVYHDPYEPKIAVVELGISDREVQVFLVMIAGSIVGLVSSVFVLRSWIWGEPKKKKKKKKRAQV